MTQCYSDCDLFTLLVFSLCDTRTHPIHAKIVLTTHILVLKTIKMNESCVWDFIIILMNIIFWILDIIFIFIPALDDNNNNKIK